MKDFSERPMVSFRYPSGRVMQFSMSSSIHAAKKLNPDSILARLHFLRMNVSDWPEARITERFVSACESAASHVIGDRESGDWPKKKTRKRMKAYRALTLRRMFCKQYGLFCKSPGEALDVLGLLRAGGQSWDEYEQDTAKFV